MNKPFHISTLLFGPLVNVKKYLSVQLRLSRLSMFKNNALKSSENSSDFEGNHPTLILSLLSEVGLINSLSPYNLFTSLQFATTVAIRLKIQPVFS